MMLNRKARRAKKQSSWRRPSPTDSPAQQMQALIQAPGKFHIVQLPEGKSFIVKPTDAEMPIFLTMCQQLRGVLGYCEVIPATPVEAHVASAQELAEQTAGDPERIRQAQARQNARTAGERAVERFVEDELAAARARHPAGKQRRGRHAAPEPDTTFDQLMTARSDDDARRLAAIELAAAQDQVARAQDQLEAANDRLRDAYERGGELHNRSVIEKFAERAGQAIAEADTGTAPQSNERVSEAFAQVAQHRARIDTARQDAIEEALRQAGHDGADT